MLPNIARRSRTCLTGLASALLIIISVPSLMAQVMEELTGTVTDPAGTPVAFALVTATSMETGRARPAATDADGSYRFNLASGNYRIKFESRGYETQEIPAPTVAALSTVVENCELAPVRLVQSDTAAEPAQKTAAGPSTKPQEPSLEDLGIPPFQAKGNAREQALLDRRTHMLKIHQRLGLITIAPLGATLLTSAFAGGRQTSRSSRDAHAALGTATAGMYFTTAYFAMRAPKIPGTKTRGPRGKQGYATNSN